MPNLESPSPPRIRESGFQGLGNISVTNSQMHERLSDLRSLLEARRTEVVSRVIEMKYPVTPPKTVAVSIVLF